VRQAKLKVQSSKLKKSSSLHILHLRGPAQSGFAQRFTLSILVGPLASRDSPDLQEEAVKTVLAQAELLCAEWV
jgi:hypothetical protein